MPFVSPVAGSASTRMSVSGSRPSSSSLVCISSKAGSAAFFVRRTPRMLLAPSALARRANSVPMSPVPTTVMVLPMMERMGITSPQRPAACSAQYAGAWRSSISVTMTMCSAMVTP